MRIRGSVKKEGRLWEVSCPALQADTQGHTKTEALEMILDWVREMLEQPKFKVEAKPDGEGEFVLIAEDSPALVALMIKRARFGSGMSLERVKENLGAASRNEFYQYENGEHEPTIGTFQRLMEAVELDVEINLVRKKA